MARTFKRNGCPLYKKLCTIYGDTTATGSNNHPSTMSPAEIDEDDNVDPTFNPNEEALLNDTFDDANTIKSRRRGHSSTNNGGQSKRANFAEFLSSILFSYNENVKRRVDIYEQSMLGSSTTHVSQQAPNTSFQLAKDSINALDKIDGIDGETYAKVIKEFAGNELIRVMFLEMSDDRKKDWVLNLK